ncbi:MAG: dehydrogenase, partial [Bacteroidia bacterium]|nr:dehydrogenase [Bacteroidia bacterium]
FGGVNFMEFYADDKVIVNPLRIKPYYLMELAHNLVLYYTQTSRISSEIIASQSKNVAEKNTISIDAMHQLKRQAVMMKEALLRGNLNDIGEILDMGWQHKKKMAHGITNSYFDEIYQTAMDAGATGGKISGAGGGGFMVFYCPGNTRDEVIRQLARFGGSPKRYDFTTQGVYTWKIK